MLSTQLKPVTTEHYVEKRAMHTNANYALKRTVKVSTWTIYLEEPTSENENIGKTVYY